MSQRRCRSLISSRRRFLPEYAMTTASKIGDTSRMYLLSEDRRRKE
uniref:Uncharacterized protein n=1 Tax=Arundo donax TaxID=35708 RepID=A0A0A9FQV6_ARUDO